MRAALCALVVAASVANPSPADATPAYSAPPDAPVSGETHRVHRPTIRPLRPPRPMGPEVPDAVPAPGALLGEIRFCVDCDALTPDDDAVLHHLAATLPAASCVTVQGHADRTGTTEHNLDLSLRRATSVADALRDRSLDAVPFGFGEARPRHRGDEADRRAEIRFSAQCPPDLPLEADGLPIRSSAPP